MSVITPISQESEPPTNPERFTVLIAQDITSRFLNVIALFNGSIPFIAIKMSAFKVGDAMTLTFTTVLNELQRGFDEDEPESSEPVDRDYWESKGSPRTVAELDKILGVVHTFAPGIDLKYNKHYIGFARDGQANNFAVSRAKKKLLNLSIKVPRSDEQDRRLEDAGMDSEYKPQYGTYWLRLAPGEVDKHQDILRDVLKAAYDARGG